MSQTQKMMKTIAGIGLLIVGAPLGMVTFLHIMATLRDAGYKSALTQLYGGNASIAVAYLVGINLLFITLTGLCLKWGVRLLTAGKKENSAETSLQA